MNLNFYKNIIDGLLEKEYSIIKNCYDNSEVDENSKFIGLIKLNGSMLNFVYIIRLDNMTQDLKAHVLNMENISKEIAEKNNIRNAVSVFIFVGSGSEITEEAKSVCFENDFDISERLISIKWIADTENAKLVVRGNQPNKIDGIEKVVNSSFENKELNFESISQAVAKNKEEKQLQIKTGNIFLTISILVLNFIVFIIMERNGGSENTENLIRFGAIVPDLIINDGQYYRLFSAMFIHIGLLHLCSNSMSLLIMGIRVEKYYGKFAFLIIYFLSGLSCSLFSIFFSRSVAAGASGAIFGLSASILSYTFIKRKSMAGFDLYMIAIILILGLGMGYMKPNVDNFGHLGGFIGGLIVSAIYLLIEGKRKK